MPSNVINFNKKRDEVVEKKRRNFERILFKDLMGCYTVVDKNDTLYSVELVDISEEGCLFQVPFTKNSIKKFKQGKKLPFRFYFTDKSYLPIVVEIRHGTEFTGPDGQKYMRYGCQFDQETHSYEVLDSFIKFIYKFAEYSSIDQGNTKINFL